MGCQSSKPAEPEEGRAEGSSALRASLDENSAMNRSTAQKLAAPIVKGAQSVGKGVETVGKGVMTSAQSVGQSVGKGVETVGKGAIKGVETVGKGAIKGVETVGKGAIKGVETVATGAVKGVQTVGRGVGRGVDEMGKRLSQVGAFLEPTQMLELLRPLGGRMHDGAHHVKNIFAKPLQELLQVDTYKPPVYPKEAEDLEFINAALKNNFVFDSLASRDLKPMVDAFEKGSVEADHVLIRQGDPGDYFYIILTGRCEFVVDDKSVGSAGPGASFGELALLYTCPRAATVKALEPVTYFRVDHLCFRFILKKLTEKGQNEKTELLKGVSFLKDLATEERSKLSRVMTPERFCKGDYLVRKGDIGHNFYILKEGSVKVMDIGDGSYEDVTLNAGDFFGERALVTGEPRSANIVAETDGLAFKIDRETFEKVVGKLNLLLLRSQDLRRLSALKFIIDSQLDSQTLSSLSKLIKDQDYKKGEEIMMEGEPVAAALYMVRRGKIQLTSQKQNTSEIKESDSYFGEEQLLLDAKLGNSRVAIATPDYTALVLEDCTVGVLILDDCRKVLDTRYFGKPPPSVNDSLLERSIRLEELKRHQLLGAGTFGQVWLVSRNNFRNEQFVYALKIQSKYELCMDGQAKAVVYEKNIMTKLNHPFLIRLVNSYQDENFVYMLMQLIQGGELYTIIHTATSNGVAEDDARFYSAGIAEGLGYMHKRGYVYRDLKPENVLINDKGYPVIIDFGFIKYIEDKTFTLCGTPLYLAPEVILNRGHNWGADHWSLGVLIYEMITGQQPFYSEGMQQMDLFRAIVKGAFHMPDSISDPAQSMIRGFLTRNPSQRLGSLAGGEEDVIEHSWFQSIDFDALRALEIKAPHVPKIRDPLDSSNFEDWSHLDDKTKNNYPKLTPVQLLIFKDF